VAYSPSFEFGSLRGTARYRTWREAERRHQLIGHPAPCKGSFEEVILVEVFDREMSGSDWRALTGLDYGPSAVFLSRIMVLPSPFIRCCEQ